jgi:hypothetical protein
MTRNEAVTCDVTYDELAEFAAGEMSAERSVQIADHVLTCALCSKRLAAIRRADNALRQVRRVAPSAGAVLNARRSLSQETRGGQSGDVLTLDEVAEFLRIGPEELGEILPELPAFEVGGQVRVRRARLMGWIERRERGYSQGTAQRDVSKSIMQTQRKGVLQ